MKNVKELLNTIKGLDKKKKAIIAGSTAGVVAVGVIAGILLMGGNNELSKVNDLPTLSREEVEEKSKDQVVVEETEEEKLYTERSLMFSELVNELKELGVDVSEYKEVPSKDEIAFVLENLGKKRDEKREEIAKAETEEVKEEVKEENNITSNSVGSSNNNSSNSGQASQSTQNPSNTQTSAPVVEQKPVEQPVQEQKPVEQPSTPAVEEQKPVEQPVQPSTPAIASGWKDDVASQVLALRRTANTNNTDVSHYASVMTPECYNYLLGIANSWVNGSMDASTAKSQMESKTFDFVDGFSTRPEQMNFAVHTVSGLDASAISNKLSSSWSGNHFIFIKVYYDANTNTSTVYCVNGLVALF